MAVPSVSVAILTTELPATVPAVGMVRLQGSTLNDLPGPQGWSAGKGDVAANVKVHEPKVVVPVAVLPPLVIVNPGALAVPPVKATVVVPVMATEVPVALVPEKPLVKVWGVAVLAAATKAVVAETAVAAVAATVVLVVATLVTTVSLLPPQPASAATKISPTPACMQCAKGAEGPDLKRLAKFLFMADTSLLS